MLSIFDQNMAIPEDKILSIRASRHGNLLYYPESVVKHPKNESTYFKSIYDHTARVHFSRFLINMEFAEKRGKYIKQLFSLQFYYYSFWRKLISLTRSVFEPKVYFQKFNGFRLAERWVKMYRRGAIIVRESIIADARMDSMQRI
jgi:hypothetical protein